MAFEQQSPLRMSCCPVSNRVPREGGSRKAPSLGKQRPPHSFAEASFFLKVLKINEQNIELSALATEG